MPSPALNTLDALRPTPTKAAPCRLALDVQDGTAWIELTGTPQTIGGGPRCTVRLDAPGLKPLHCVITPTERGAVVRRWAEATELNGQTFDEAALSAGDLLRIGAVNLRVVALPDPVAPAVAAKQENAQPDAPAAASAAPADGVESWFGNSLDLFQAAEDALASGEAIEAFDPAIPSRLLKPWTPERPSAPVVEVAVTPQAASQPDAVEPSPPAEPLAELAPESIAAPTAEANNDPWSVAVEPAAAAVLTTFDDAAAAAFAAKPVAADPVAIELSSELLSAAIEATSPTVERGRLEAARRRVRRLVEALRRERGLLGAWSQACAERDSLIANLQTRLDEALVAVQLASDELARRSHEALASAPSVFTDVAAEPSDEAGQGVEASASAWGPFENAAESTVENTVENTVEELVEPALEPAWEALEHERDAADMAPASLWGAVEEVAPSPSEPTIGESEFPETELPETDAVVEEGPMWGIEQLAAEAPSEPVAALWNDAPAEDESLSVEHEALHSAEPTEEAFELPQHNVQENAKQGLDLAEPEAQAFEQEDVQESPVAVPAPPHQPASFIERFAHLVPEEGEPVESVKVAVRQEHGAVAKASGEEEDSIDEYMRKLMQRVRGGGESAVASSQAPASPAAAAAPAAVAEALAPAAEAVAPQAPIRDLSEIRRSPTSSPRTDLGALRQLANQSARSAIDVANTRVSRERAGVRLVVSAVVLACGALAAVTASSPFEVQFGAGIAGAAAGCWLGVRTLRSCQSASTKAEYDALANRADR